MSEPQKVTPTMEERADALAVDARYETCEHNQAQGSPRCTGCSSAAILTALLAVQSETRAETGKAIIGLVEAINAQPCYDKSHDERWCSTCETREDALDEVTGAIFARFPDALPAKPEEER
jgi:hydroxymethylpyrimidine/phosphomethylpyrimidine kinase